jgi:hypothetical protein
MAAEALAFGAALAGVAPDLVAVGGSADLTCTAAGRAAALGEAMRRAVDAGAGGLAHVAAAAEFVNAGSARAGIPPFAQAGVVLVKEVAAAALACLGAALVSRLAFGDLGRQDELELELEQELHVSLSQSR